MPANRSKGKMDLRTNRGSNAMLTSCDKSSRKKSKPRRSLTSRVNTGAGTFRSSVKRTIGTTTISYTVMRSRPNTSQQLPLL
uniref:Uncharacterized protein n=1 Tax=Anopheles dirus TaxID=7168 RepID=A0A182NAN3_9DIPT